MWLAGVEGATSASATLSKLPSSRMSSMTTPEYRIEIGGTRDFKITRNSDGKVIPLDDDNVDFCNFATWAAGGDVALPKEFRNKFPFENGSRFYCRETTEQLFEAIKASGAILFAQPVNGGKWRIRRTGRHTVGGTRFWQIMQAYDASKGDQPDAVGFAARKSTLHASGLLFSQIDATFCEEDSGFRCLSTWPVRRAFVYFDISDFSRYDPGKQVLIINSLASLTSSAPATDSVAVINAFSALDTRICIGDGYIFCFKNSVDATFFAAHLAKQIETMNADGTLPVEFHFRCGVHVGDVYRFWDPGRGEFNYVGKGINDGCRVLEAIGKEVDDVVFVSKEVQQDLISADGWSTNTLLHSLQNRGRRADKHRELRRVYELNHMAAVPPF